MTTAPTPPDQDQRATLATHHCIAVACTGCGQHYDDEFTHHFASVAHALRVITNEDWVVTEDTVLCWQCGSHDAPRAPTPAALTRCEYCYTARGSPMPRRPIPRPARQVPARDRARRARLRVRATAPQTRPPARRGAPEWVRWGVPRLNRLIGPWRRT